MRITKWHILLGLGAFVFGCIFSLVRLRERMEPLTEEVLAAARQQWKDAGIRDYDLRYRMHGSVYEVAVRDGIVLSMRVDGLESRSTDPSAYGVDGLFEILALELEGLADPRGPFAGNRAVLMRVRFHENLGYIERYLRGGDGGQKGVAIELLAFEPVK